MKFYYIKNAHFHERSSRYVNTMTSTIMILALSDDFGKFKIEFFAQERIRNIMSKSILMFLLYGTL